MQRTKFYDALRLFCLRVDVAAVVGAIDSQAFNYESVAAQQQIGNRMLVIDLIVGVGVEQDADFFGHQTLAELTETFRRIGNLVFGIRLVLQRIIN